MPMNDHASRMSETEQPVGGHEPIREMLEGLSLCSPGPEYFPALVSVPGRTSAALQRQQANRALERAHADLAAHAERSEELERVNADLQREIAERQHCEKQMTHDAMHDGVTGLPNRSLFMNRLDHAI